ncbi:tetratricopeptide repeat protein [Dokdonella sp.]|uniref:tetratricopeptide repeat protein n=1 Tax=Dokdonella sp. TaxID=2291710 RepID=UPI003C5A10B1
MKKRQKPGPPALVNPPRRPLWHWLLAVAALVAIAWLIHFLGNPTSEPKSVSSAPVAIEKAEVATGKISEPASYVGADACSGCHADQFGLWQTSQHGKAMQHATLETVLGDFKDASFRYANTTSTFFRRGDEFWVRTDGADGQMDDFQISYTFGLYPLQQYLIKFPDGRMQALSIAWDSRPAKEGGQRWFHLYPEENVDFKDELHWTKGQQNWNYMCADCHSTHLQRNYDEATDRYATTWSDLNVGCESCHGPGSAHVAWASDPNDASDAAGMGLSIPLDKRQGVTWIPDPATGNASRSTPMRDNLEVETCAVCHARRGSVSTHADPTGRLLDTHNPSLLTETLYFADGQQLDEVYTYGSFLQSKMHAAGVTCSDCHDPHTAKLRLPGNGVCGQCHSAAKYDVAEHSHHQPGSAGAECANCHMPTRPYMVVDPRHDHSMRIPRPDLSEALETPNACNNCHTDQDPAWAAAAIEEWFGTERKGFQNWGEAFHAARNGQSGSVQNLARLFADPEVPGIARATALAEMQRFPSRLLLAAITDGLADKDPMVRIAALDALTGLPVQLRSKAIPSTSDEVQSVRARAGRALAPTDMNALTPQQRADVERGFEAFEASQLAIAERPEAHLNLGIYFSERNDPGRAESQYQHAIRLDPGFVAAYANLADLYRATARETEAARTLDEGLAAVPNDPTLVHSVGLLRIREGRTKEALELFAQAHASAPANTRFAYVYAVALRSDGQPQKAQQVLDRALDGAPNAPDLLYARASYALEDGDMPVASEFANRFISVAPEDPRAMSLLQATNAR